MPTIAAILSNVINAATALTRTVNNNGAEAASTACDGNGGAANDGRHYCNNGNRMTDPDWLAL